MATYDTNEIMEVLTEKFGFEELEKQEKVKKMIKSIVDTINYDLKISVMRPYSHNVIGLCLSSIAQLGSEAMANEVIIQIPAIYNLYRINPV